MESLRSKICPMLRAAVWGGWHCFGSFGDGDLDMGWASSSSSAAGVEAVVRGVTISAESTKQNQQTMHCDDVSINNLTVNWL
jgi:hypothetical protein